MPSEEIQRLGPQGLTGWHTYHPLRLLIAIVPALPVGPHIANSECHNLPRSVHVQHTVLCQ